MLLKWWVLCALAVWGAYTPKVTEKEFSSHSHLMYFDDLPNVLNLVGNAVYLSTDDGAKWDQVDSIKGQVVSLVRAPFDQKSAIAATDSTTHYATLDLGKTWNSFTTEGDGTEFLNLLSFYNSAPYALSTVEVCARPGNCVPKLYYTKDMFALQPVVVDDPHLLGCVFAKSSHGFTHGDEELILCVSNKEGTPKVVYTTDWFASFHDAELPVPLLIEAADLELYLPHVVQNYVCVVVLHRRGGNNQEQFLFTSTDGKTFLQAKFGAGSDAGGAHPRLYREQFTVMASEYDLLHVAIWLHNVLHNDRAHETHRGKGREPSDVLLIYILEPEGKTFNKFYGASAGTHEGIVQLQKVSANDELFASQLNGVWLAEVSTGVGEHNLVRHAALGLRILFNDGRTWDKLLVDESVPENKAEIDACHATKGIQDLDTCDLYLILSTEDAGGGVKGTTGPAPGIIMGVGLVIPAGTANTIGQYLTSKTWLLRDAGLLWTKVIDEPCVFLFGDQGNVILAVPVALLLKGTRAYYLVDQGATWTEFLLSKRNLTPFLIVTTVDGTGTKFVVSALLDATRVGEKTLVVAVDLSQALTSTCLDGDMEDWYPGGEDGVVAGRKEYPPGDPKCIRGMRQRFRRRKQFAKCFVNQLYKENVPSTTYCRCTVEDNECNFGLFANADGTCVQDTPVLQGMCEGKPNTTVISIPMYRLRRGNACVGYNTPKTQLSMECGQIHDHATNSNVMLKVFQMEGDVVETRYLLKPYKVQEPLFVRTLFNKVYMLQDGGVSFVEIQHKVPGSDRNEEFLSIYHHPHYSDYVYLLTGSPRLYVSRDAGQLFRMVTMPLVPSRHIRVMDFSKATPDRFVWYQDDHCRDAHTCEYTAWLVGLDYQATKMGDNLGRCWFVGAAMDPQYSANKDLMYCMSRRKGDATYSDMVLSTDYFKTRTTVFERTVGFALVELFAVTAQGVPDHILDIVAYLSVDGTTFAEARFPHDVQVGHSAFTFVDLSTKAIFMHVTTDASEGARRGVLLKSNYNGTDYTLVLRDVNRDKAGYVDYERIKGLDGIMAVNTVANPDEASNGAQKRLKTKMTFNDGGEWFDLKPPHVDLAGKPYPCVEKLGGQSDPKLLAKCSLNLLSYTARTDSLDTYALGLAVGFMMANGAVGALYGPQDAVATFLSRDGGTLWTEVYEGRNMWEYGDQGLVIVLVHDGVPTTSVKFSVDGGLTFREFQFSSEPVVVTDLTTVPLDTLRHFVVWAQSTDRSKRALVAYLLDFTGVFTRQCVLDLKNPLKDDFEYFSPRHPDASDTCVFGRESAYLRRRASLTSCYVGDINLTEGYKKVRNCPCTRKDYECDYNYQRDVDGTCKLVKGYTPPNRLDMCKADPKAFEYFEPTGYRKIALSTCEGGTEFDRLDPKPCPGHEDEFRKEHLRNIGVLGWLGVTAVPIVVFALALWFVYERGIRRNGGFARFGEIRLGDDDLDLVENTWSDKVVNKVVTFGVAVFQVLMLVVRLRLLLNSRQWFGGSRRTYVLVPGDDDLFQFQDESDELMEDAEEI